MNDDEWEAMLKRVAERQAKSGPDTWLPVSEVVQGLPTNVASQRPQPIDYGLTRDDLNLYNNLSAPWGRPIDGKYINCIGTRPDDTYRQGRRWFGVILRLSGLIEAIMILGGSALPIGVAVILGEHTVIGFRLIAFGSVCVLITIIPSMIITRIQKRARPTLEKYWLALHTYEEQKAAAKEAARKAAHEAELRKRSYWALLDGYAFERATAEVMQKHQFTALVTPGSGDGGIDIEVTRNGLKGVVQCKAHTSCVGPHVVRDLYGVINHCGASFGIIVSRGGFTRGALDFARDKPILFLDVDDLIAMQEGRDVLAAAFAGSSSDTGS